MMGIKSARKEVEKAFRWIKEQSPQGADRWYNGLMETLGSLTNQP